MINLFNTPPHTNVHIHKQLYHIYHIHRVAFFDATNTTQARRKKLLERNRRESRAVSLIFVESVCDDPDVLQRNYQLKLQNNGAGLCVFGWCVCV
jgi:hypothetical protein